MHLRDFTTLIPQPVRFEVRRAVHRGTGVRCVLCGTEVRGFKPHGGGAEVLETRQVIGGRKREDDRCPVCHGRDRTRLIMLWLQTNDALKPGTEILHVAPDLGLTLWLQREHPAVAYTGADLDASRYRHIENFVPTDLTAAPFPDARFDVVICSHVLEHIPDDAKAFSEILRILKPGGHALLLVPFAIDGRGTDEDLTVADPAEKDRRFGQWDHVRLYDRDDFVARMGRAGFETTLFDPCTSDPETARRLRLNPLELLPVGRKPLDAGA